MKILHDVSVGLSVRDEDAGELRPAVYVEYPATCECGHGRRTGIILFDRVYHALATEKRSALRQHRGAEVRGCWLLLATATVGGKPVKTPRLHFVDYSSRTFNVKRVNGGATLRLPAAQVPTESDVRAANTDPEHPLWDAMLPLLHPHHEAST